MSCEVRRTAFLVLFTDPRCGGVQRAASCIVCYMDFTGSTDATSRALRSLCSSFRVRSTVTSPPSAPASANIIHLGNLADLTAPHNLFAHLLALERPRKLGRTTRVAIEGLQAKWLPYRKCAVAGAVSLHHRVVILLLTATVSQATVAPLLYTLPKSDCPSVPHTLTAGLFIHTLQAPSSSHQKRGIYPLTRR